MKHLNDRAMSNEINKKKLWIFMSFAWTEIGLTQAEMDIYFKHINISPSNLPNARKLIFFDFCGAFSIFTVLSFISIGTLLPDWSFEEDYIVNKVLVWVDRPLWYSLFNPIWLTGYPLTCLLALPYWRKLYKCNLSIGDLKAKN